MSTADVTAAREAATRERIAAARARGADPGASVIAATRPEGDALTARRALVARAKQFGIPATGRSVDLEAAIAAAEAAAAGEPG